MTKMGIPHHHHRQQRALRLVREVGLDLQANVGVLLVRVRSRSDALATEAEDESDARRAAPRRVAFVLLLDSRRR